MRGPMSQELPWGSVAVTVTVTVTVTVAVAVAVAVAPVRRLAARQIDEIAQCDVGIYEVEPPGGVRHGVNDR